MEKRKHGRIQGLPKFWGTSYYLRNGKSYGFQFGQYIQRVYPNKIPLKKFGEKGAWAHPGTAQFFQVPPIIPGTGKATDFKFGQYIQRIHPNKIPLKYFGEKGAWAYPGTAHFFGYPLLSLEREKQKLRISNLASTFRGSIPTKAH